MKLNFKTILIIFLVSILGSGIGTFGVNSYLKKEQTSPKEDIVINKVEYTNINKSEYTQAIEKAYNTVVEVEAKIQTTTSYFFYQSESQISTSAGSGVIISDNGYIVTNYHVIDGLANVENAITIKLYNDETYYAEVIGADEKTDIAVLKINANNLEYATFADSSDLLLGQDVIAIGNPLGSGLSCSNGIVSALEKEIYINKVYMSVIQTNAAVNSGNSGGGLFDINGNLIGIVNAKNSSTTSSTTVEGMGYAIPSNKVVSIVKELIENGYVKNRPALGVKVYSSNSFYANIDGVIVSEVIEGGAAKEAGMKENDIIKEINGTKVSSYADLSKVLDNLEIGETVEVKVIRNNEELSLELTLKETSIN